MAIADQLLALNSVKSGIKSAIEAKGVTVGSVPFAEYATKIADIATGLPRAGDLWDAEGGYYAGTFYDDSDNLYALIVSPKSTEINGIEWALTTNNDGNPTSYWDGLLETNRLNDANHPAHQAARAVSAGGKTDWHLPIAREVATLQRTLFPGTDIPNHPLWVVGGAQAFQVADTTNTGGYWMPNQASSSSGRAIQPWLTQIVAWSVTTGVGSSTSKTIEANMRAVRYVLLD